MTMKLDYIETGDCITAMNKLDAGSVDLAFADPPFNIGYKYDVYDDRRSADEYLAWSREWIKGVIRALKPSGTFWLAIGDEFAAELKVLCTRDLGLHCRSWVIWYYTFGVHCTHKFTRSHAHLLYFVKDRKQFTFNADAVRVPSARQLVYGDKRAVAGGRMPDDTWMMSPDGRPPATDNGQQEEYDRNGNFDPGSDRRKGAGRPAASSPLPPDVPTRDGFVLRPQDVAETFTPDKDVWFFSRVAGTFAERQGFHGCQMPEQLLGRIIRACSNKGEVVLDPFAGSGTTLAVAKKLGRRFIGFELSVDYAKNIRNRLGSIRAGDPLEGPENAALSAPKTRAGRAQRLNGRSCEKAETLLPLSWTDDPAVRAV